MCGGGKVFQVNQRLEITFDLVASCRFPLNQFAGQALDGQAAGAMAGFTVHQGHAGFFFELRTHGAGVKELFQLVVLMTGGKTILGADVISIEVADNHLFIFADRQNRS